MDERAVEGWEYIELENGKEYLTSAFNRVGITLWKEDHGYLGIELEADYEAAVAEVVIPTKVIGQVTTGQIKEIYAFGRSPWGRKSN